MITDKEYILSTVITIRTLAKHSILKNKYHIFIIANDNCQKIWHEKYNETYENIDIEFVGIPKEISEFDYSHVYVSKTAISKFFIANILSDLEKVLYIDGDILVRKDLKELYDIDIKKVYVAAIKDMLTYEGTHLSDIGVKEYFNSGVMLLNLKAIREDDICNKLLEYKKNEKNSVFMDQDSFNVIMNEKVAFVSPKYNMIYECFSKYKKDEIAAFYGVDIEDVENPIILHMAGPIKPWSHIESNQYEEWFSYIRTYEELAFCIRNFHKRDQEQLILYADRKYNQILSQLQQQIEGLSMQLNEMKDRQALIEKQFLNMENKFTMLDYSIQNPVFGDIKRE